MAALAHQQPAWIADAGLIRSSGRGRIYIAECKQTEALAEALDGFAGRVVMQVQHAIPHECSRARRQALLDVYARADRILTPHRRLADALAGLGVERDKMRILQGYPYRRTGVPASRLRRPGFLLALGYHDKASGIDRLIELARLNRGAQMPMLVAGTMDGRDARALRLAGCQVIRRFLDEREMGRLLASAGCLLMPYRKPVESPLLNRAIEAGLPVLRTPGVRDWNASADAPGWSLPWHAQDWLEAANMLAQSFFRLGFRKTLAISRIRLRRQLADALMLSMDSEPGLPHERGVRR